MSEIRTERNNSELKILTKIIKDKDYNILSENNLTKNDFKDYFVKEGQKLYLISDIVDYIDSYYKTSSQVPDETTIKTKFPLLELNNDDYSSENKTFIDNLKKLNKDDDLINAMTQANRIHQTKGARDAISFLQGELEKLEGRGSEVKGYDLIQNVDDRINEYEELLKNPNKAFVTTGLKELDNCIKGWLRDEELVLIQGRSGQSKTFFLLKFLWEAFARGENVLLFEPEMSSKVIGYRLDVLADDNHEISNFSLLRGERFIDANKYKACCARLKEHKNHFYYLCPDDFEDGLTVSQLKAWCKKNKITIVGIDGIEIPDIIDERKGFKDEEHLQLTHIAADLLRMSKTLKVPVIVTTQAKRTDKKEELSINTIGSSYGMARKCTIMITIKKEDREVEIRIEKSRNSTDNQVLNYKVDLDKGIFEWDGMPTIDEQTNQSINNREAQPITDVDKDKSGITEENIKFTDENGKPYGEDVFLDGGKGLE